MNNTILCSHRINGIFCSFEPTRYDIAKVLKEQSRWMTCAEIAEMIYGVTARPVYYHLSVLLKSPGGRQVIEVEKGEKFKPNRYRCMPEV